MKNNPKFKKFVIRKYIMAKSAKHAILLDRRAPVDDVWVDEKWMEANHKIVEVGFNTTK